LFGVAESLRAGFQISWWGRCGVSTVITASHLPQDWFSVFPDSVIGDAILDRLVYGAIKFVITKNRSYRKEGHRSAGIGLKTHQEGP